MIAMLLLRIATGAVWGLFSLMVWLCTNRPIVLKGVNPQALLDWIRAQIIDAADWAVVSKIIGMAPNADGGLHMTKPYAAGGPY